VLFLLVDGIPHGVSVPGSRYISLLPTTTTPTSRHHDHRTHVGGRVISQFATRGNIILHRFQHQCSPRLLTDDGSCWPELLLTTTTTDGVSTAFIITKPPETVLVYYHHDASSSSFSVVVVVVVLLLLVVGRFALPATPISSRLRPTTRIVAGGTDVPPTSLSGHSRHSRRFARHDGHVQCRRRLPTPPPTTFFFVLSEKTGGPPRNQRATSRIIGMVLRI
jgi:hypothetical protein